MHRATSVIRKRGKKWVLLSTRGRVLGTHTSHAKAEKQERAIQISKARARGHDIPAPDNPGHKKRKRKLSPAQLAALAKGRATMAAKREGHAAPKKRHSHPSRAPSRMHTLRIEIVEE